MTYWRETFVDPNDAGLTREAIIEVIGPPTSECAIESRWMRKSHSTQAIFRVSLSRETGLCMVSVVSQHNNTQVLIGSEMDLWQFSSLACGLQIDNRAECLIP